MANTDGHPWSADELGNHRAVIETPTGSSDAVFVRVPWRRRDVDPASRGVKLIAAGGSEPVRNLVRLVSNRECGEFVFQPTSGVRRYFLYYLPYTGTVDSPYPKIEYVQHEDTADPAWLTRHGLAGQGGADGARFPTARFVGCESVDEFNAFTDMEQPAAPAALAGLLATHAGAPFLVFAEDRVNPIRMARDLPRKWLRPGPGSPFVATACRGEFFVFQIGVYAAWRELGNVRAEFPDLAGPAGHRVPCTAWRCFNTGGTAWDGAEFAKQVDVPEGRVQALWCGVQVPEDRPPGRYRGRVTVCTDQGSQTVELCLDVEDRTIVDAGDDEPWRLSRLRWLDSTKGTEDEVVPPFTPVEVAGNTLRILGRRVELADTGLPRQVTSLFSTDVTDATGPPTDLLAAAMRFVAETVDGEALVFVPESASAPAGTAARAEWHAVSRAGPLRMRVAGSLSFDGCVELRIAIDVLAPGELGDIRLEAALRPEVARYAMGLGVKGGRRPARIDWRWSREKNQDALWLGSVNAGVQVSLRDEHYSRPLNTNFYHLKPLVMPQSWANDGKGGIRVQETDAGVVRLTCFSGARTIAAGDVLRFDCRLLLTPFKPLDTRAHFRTRFYHRPVPVDEAISKGANTVNIHHANDLNPYINYPFLRPDELGTYIEEAHAKDCRVKLYYTVRELTTRAPELFALKSLGDEVLVDGPGGGHVWLMEHLESNYIAAWYARSVRDTSVINGVLSRWHNFYIEGMDWLARKLAVDGVYLDDVGFGREVMLRLRRVLARRRSAPLIDLHSANQYNEKDGFANSAGLYMELLPYVDRLWFGEYFDYDSAPDYWLVEVSGIPFGLMGEMLQGGGNPWRGMLFGMTGRMPAVALAAELWHVWDRYGLPEMRMIGWWSDDCPVRTGHGAVLATAFIGSDSVVVALASWAPDPVDVQLRIDWHGLGLGPTGWQVVAPAIDGFQPRRTFAIEAPIPVEPGKGWLLVLGPEDA